MGNYDVSIFASAIRKEIWKECLESLLLSSINIEVVFGGNCTKEQVKPFLDKYKFFKYIHTENIKPNQVYEATRRYCTGETIAWFCDDAEAVNDVYGKAYRYWKSKKNEKLILSIQTKESGYGQKNSKLFPMKEHTFYSLMPDTPLMCPMNLMSRKFLDELGGYDRRYTCGQSENDVCCRAYQHGANVEIFGDETCYVDIDHLSKSIAIGESTDEESFKERPFAKGYHLDRQVLENSWTTFDQVDAFKRLQAGERPISLRRISHVQLDKFEPYSNPISLEKSEGNNLPERWV